jgi:hypothetical protein
MKTLSRGSIRKLLFIPLILLLIILYSQPSVSEEIPSQAIPVAEKALSVVLNNLSGDKFIEDFGFSENDSIEDAVLGEPFFMYAITPNALFSYRLGSAVKSMISKTGLLYFPILIVDEYKCLLFLSQQNGLWKLAGYGRARTAKYIGKLRKKWPPAEGDHPLIITVYETSDRFFTIPEKGSDNLTRLFSLNNSEQLPRLQLVEDIVEELLPAVESSLEQ